MAGLFDLLNTVIGKITQNSVTYATAPTPPDGDDSTKVATTAFVADKTAAIPSGNVAVWSRSFTNSGNYACAPSGGSWFCWGNFTLKGNNGTTGSKCEVVGVYSGGAQIGQSTGAPPSCYFLYNNLMAIKIA